MSNSASRISSTRCDAGRAVDRQAPQDRAPDEHRPRSERERLEHIGAPTDTAVDEHVESPADRVDDRWQRIGARENRVELAAAVIRDDDAARAVLQGEPRVLAASGFP